MTPRPHHDVWKRIAATIDNARKPEPTRLVKTWPAHALKELQRHMAGMPETRVFVSYHKEDGIR